MVKPSYADLAASPTPAAPWTVSAARKCARWSASRTANSTTGRAPDLLRPSIADARGSGTQRRYAYTDLLELKVIKQLLDAGISLQRARRAVECLRDGLGADLASTNLVLVGTDSVLAHSDGEVVDLLRGGQGVLNIVPLSGVVEELDADILRSSVRPPAPATAASPPSRRRGRRKADRGTVRRGSAATGAVTARFAHDSERHFARAARLLRRALGVRARRVRPRLARRRLARAAFRPDFYLPDHPASSS